MEDPEVVGMETMKDTVRRLGATEEDRIPWGQITESGWTYFGSIIFTVILFILFHLKYERKVIKRPKNLKKPKNEKVLESYLLAQEKAAHTILPRGEQDIEQFLRYCSQRKKHPVIYKIEFSSAVDVAGNGEESHSVAMADWNRGKNRTLEIVPFNKSRVVLDVGEKSEEGDEEEEEVAERKEEGEVEGEGEREKEKIELDEGVKGDYINASYCSGLVEGWNYIVTQGTMDTTLLEFWAMVWQEKVPIIVMLTKTFDYIRVMCAQYWPTSLHREEMYGYRNGHKFSVTVVEELHYASYIHRTMVIKRGSEQRQIEHLQYTEWPCYGSPATSAVIHFQQRVTANWEKYIEGSEVQSGASTWLDTDGDTARKPSAGRKPQGPCMVHCHDGGGRSGVFVAFDANVRLADKVGKVDVFSYLGRMRNSRPGLVASQEQYKLVYSLLEEKLICGNTVCSVQDILHRAGPPYSDGDTESDVVSSQYELLNRIRPTLTQGDCAGGHRLDNRGKNRSVLVLPSDAHRPYITSFQGNDCTDYINAVFVDGHIQANDSIVTEWPLQGTLQNFWSTVYDHEVTTVVVLDSPKSSAKYPAFWPAEIGKPKKYGPVFSVEKVEDGKEQGREQGYSSYRLLLCKKEVAPHRKTQSLYVDDKQVSSLTNLVVGVTAPVKQCQVYQLHSWNQSDRSPGLAEVLSSMIQSARSHRDVANPESPVIVVSADGAERAGVYCTVSHCWDQLRREGQADIVHAVRCLRLSRPQLIVSIAEYSLCYRVLAASLEEK